MFPECSGVIPECFTDKFNFEFDPDFSDDDSTMSGTMGRTQSGKGLLLFAEISQNILVTTFRTTPKIIVRTKSP